jgi:transposase
MMGQQEWPQRGLFYHRFDLEQRVRADHPLRAVERLIDFRFVCTEVEDLYGSVGRESVPPPIILKLMFLLFFYDVRSERELMATVPERLDWLWFLGFDIDTPIPNHSVLSKARHRWGAKAFETFFRRIVVQCRDLGLVEGEKIFCDSSIVDANASIDSIVTAACVRLDDSACESSAPEPKGYSTTDPEAAVVSKRGSGPARPRYKTHRAIDQSGVITATILTPGDVDEGRRLDDLIEEHQNNTGTAVKTAVADSQYGSAENLLACHDRGIQAHMSVRGAMHNPAAERGLFDKNDFIYDRDTDTLICPNGERLRRHGKPDPWGVLRYNAAPRVCRQCPIKSQCTTATRRTVRRHLRQDELTRIVANASTRQARRDLRLRQWMLEGSFGQATRYGLKRARYRGLISASIQDFLIAAIQNILFICRCTGNRRKAASAALANSPNILEKSFSNLLKPTADCIPASIASLAALDELSVILRSPWARTTAT